MGHRVDLILTPQQAADWQQINKAVASQMQLPLTRLREVRMVRKSIDARQRQPKILLSVLAYIDNEPIDLNYEKPVYRDVHGADRQVVIVGAGPAGLFAALQLLECGVKPIILERGKDVSSRKVDVALLNRNQALNGESNYCFGEGGAGTFSDGKLYSRSNKRGNIHRVMEIFHFHGADDSILYEAHPHIGSDRLPQIIRNMRETILSCGGEIHFGARVEDIIIEAGVAKGCRTADEAVYTGDAVFLALGHSAHDTYRMLEHVGIRLEPKGFALGVRVEHPQRLIDRLMYHGTPRGEYLPAATYSLVTQVDGRGVYSFCMCPGGHIVPASSENGSCVVNGMSASKRNSPYANSGIVVEVHPDDLPAAYSGALGALRYQEELERRCWQEAHRNSDLLSVAPAQRLRDFVEGRDSASLPSCSYLPGIVPSRLDLWLPAMISRRLQQGFRDFDRRYRGFLTNEAVIVGVESRSSSPIRIPRDSETLQHVDIKGLYPCGEGAGYAGGITSSAMDGINAAIKFGLRD